MSAQRIAAASEINVTSMLDVLLVLLVAFMAATIEIRRAMDAQLPQPCVGACASSSGDDIVVEVMPGGRRRINHRDVSADALGQELRSIYAARPSKIIAVAGYPGVRYQDVVTTMDVAGSAGVRVISVAPRSAYLEPLSPFLEARRQTSSGCQTCR